MEDVERVKVNKRKTDTFFSASRRKKPAVVGIFTRFFTLAFFWFFFVCSLRRNYVSDGHPCIPHSSFQRICSRVYLMKIKYTYDFHISVRDDFVVLVIVMVNIWKQNWRITTDNNDQEILRIIFHSVLFFVLFKL